MSFESGSDWAVVKRHVETQLARAREGLESPKLNWDDTQAKRGEIAAYKRILGLPEELAAQAQQVVLSE